MNPKLRAILRLLLFVTVAAGLLSLKRLALRQALHGVDSTAVYILNHLIDLVVLLVFASIMAREEHRPFGVFGLPWRRALRSEFWQGAAVGIASLVALMLVLQATGAVHIARASTPAPKGAAMGVVYFAVLLMLAMREEFGFRGYGLFTLTELTGFWPAVLATSAWFLSAHAGIANENWLGLVNVGVFGVLACVMLRRTGNLWMPIGFHTTWNWGQVSLFGVSVSGHDPAPGNLLASTVSTTSPAWLSGASVGPEGSALCTALIVVLIMVYAWALRGVRYPEAAPAAVEIPADQLQPAG